MKKNSPHLPPRTTRAGARVRVRVRVATAVLHLHTEAVIHHPLSIIYHHHYPSSIIITPPVRRSSRHLHTSLTQSPSIDEVLPFPPSSHSSPSQPFPPWWIFFFPPPAWASWAAAAAGAALGSIPPFSATTRDIPLARLGCRGATKKQKRRITHASLAMVVKDDGV